jgi:DNA-directed RNA polymerase subunit M/transcription elongation factor TFIIS
MTHLKQKHEYVDLYDRHTVDICRRTEKSFSEKEDEPLPEVEGVTKEQAEAARKYAKEWYLKIQTGERYLNKEKTIREWMDADERKDNLLEHAQAPEGIRCLTCRNLVKPTFKELWWHDDGKPERVLFMYDCPNQCMPRRAFFSDGEEWRPKPHLCPTCNVALTPKDEVKDDKAIFTRTCPKCGYAESEEMELSAKKEDEFDPNFAADRDRFCLTDEQGREFSDFKFGLEQMAKFSDEWKEKEKQLAERLEANPDGFILEGVGRNCAICGQGSREDGSWYDKYGLKCLVCQKAIDVGEIPASLAQEKDSWYSKWDLESNFNLTHHAIKKWVKDGLLKSRTVSQYGKGVHVEIFLIEDNKEFLPPKNLLEGRSVKYKKDGKDWFTTQKWYEFQDPLEHLKGYKIMEHMRVVPPEEMAAREEEKKRKWEQKQALREAKRKKKK